MLSVDGQHKIEQVLLDTKAVSKEQLEAVRTEAAKSGSSLLGLLVTKKLINDEELTKLYAKASGVPYVNLGENTVAGDLLKLLPKATAQTYMAVPFGKTAGNLAVAMLEPTNIQATDFIARKTGMAIAPYMASRTAIEHVLGQYPADVSEDVTEAVESAAGLEVTEDKQGKAVPKANAKDVQNLVQDAPITRALNTILDYAAQSQASDIHIEPRKDDLKIRYRIDGILQETMSLPKSIEPALISRIKILSNLKIDEHRVPQDGEFQIKSGDKDIDLRIAISPVVWGEQVVIRLLEKDDSILTLDKLGSRGRALRNITEGLKRPHGMTLSTGPTGSGKSTTLYAALSSIKNSSINIVTLEDPVEYKMDGVNQIQINPDVGLTFATGLRSVLRQDPNVIMVGEIRDKETADLAVQAALTGHIVLSTLHTNSAAGVLPRLLDMQVEPFLIASTVNTVIGQRLVRKICDKCKEQIEATPAQVKSINETLDALLPKGKEDMKRVQEDVGYDNLPLSGQKAYTLSHGKGCSECGTTGYKGRIGIYEVFSMTEAMERLLVAHATTGDIQKQAEADGMITMKQDGYLKALIGVTTLEEVARVASDY
jgi:type IV pilus assembly protein PilB